jgi:hypothetical protein
VNLKLAVLYMALRVGIFFCFLFSGTELGRWSKEPEKWCRQWSNEATECIIIRGTT